MQPHIRELGLQDYIPVWQDMLTFNKNRTSETIDEIWILQHRAVFTQGKAGKAEHLFDASGIPVVQSDRGGQITYHGEGQLIMYLLLDLHRLKIGIKTLVSTIEQAIIALLAQYQIHATLRDGAPGVYVGADKIASLGLRVQRGCTLHGLSLNIDMDLTPFSYIRPCGLSQIGVTQMIHFDKRVQKNTVAEQLRRILIGKLYKK